jgi:hypothetical protein
VCHRRRGEQVVNDVVQYPGVGDQRVGVLLHLVPVGGAGFVGQQLRSGV